MNSVKVNVSKDCKIELPKQVVKRMLLKEGDSLVINFDPESFVDKCFFIEEDTTSKMEKEEYFCIPLRLIENAGLLNQDIQVVLGDEELTITSSENIIRAMPSPFIEALVEQEVDLIALADGVAERMNHYVLESEEEYV